MNLTLRFEESCFWSRMFFVDLLLLFYEAETSGVLNSFFFQKKFGKHREKVQRISPNNILLGVVQNSWNNVILRKQKFNMLHSVLN